MPARPMHMAMGKLLRRRLAHLDNVEVESQRLPGARVVQIHIHHLAADLDHCDRAHAFIGLQGDDENLTAVVDDRTTHRERIERNCFGER